MLLGEFFEEIDGISNDQGKETASDNNLQDNPLDMKEVIQDQYEKCDPGITHCKDGLLYYCDDNGNWQGKTCQNGYVCADGACVKKLHMCM